MLLFFFFFLSLLSVLALDCDIVMEGNKMNQFLQGKLKYVNKIQKLIRVRKHYVFYFT